MGLNAISASMLLAEHRYRPITGVFLTIGRQTIGLTAIQCDALLQRYGIEKRPGAEYKIDGQTTGYAPENAYVSQESFFGAFCDAKVESIDVTNYENADIVHDLQDDLPTEYHGYADFVLNGSCLDNIFDPAAAIKNMSRLLKSGGRIYHFEQGNAHATAYLKYSADWFFDYYAINNFEDCKTYIVDSPNTVDVPTIGAIPAGLKRRSPFTAVVYNFNPYVETPNGAGYDCSSIEAFSRYEIHCIAEKKEDSTEDRKPIQKHYRVDPVHRAICLESARRFRDSPRPLFWNGITFDANAPLRIDSSDFPEQIAPVSVFGSNWL